MLLITIGLQFGLGWSALATGAATVPISLILVLGSSRVGPIAAFGARLLIAPGCALMAVGSLILMGLGTGSSYWTLVLPGVVVFGSGLVLVVAPITTTALGDIPVSASGVGSGVNNAVGRVASLIAIAVVPLIAGLATVDPPGNRRVARLPRRHADCCDRLCHRQSSPASASAPAPDVGKPPRCSVGGGSATRGGGESDGRSV